jgi:hypothetical protein
MNHYEEAICFLTLLFLSPNFKVIWSQRYNSRNGGGVRWCGRIDGLEVLISEQLADQPSTPTQFGKKISCGVVDVLKTGSYVSHRRVGEGIRAEFRVNGKWCGVLVALK